MRVSPATTAPPLQQLVKALTKNGLITTASIATAMSHVDRGDFCLDPAFAYRDEPQYIGFGATISAPHMHATALELLENKLRPGAKVLDVGSGSGYLVAVMGRMVSPSGVVVGIDHIPELVEQSLRNLEKSNNDLLASGIVQVHACDGFDGYPAQAPYDVIHVGAAAPEIPSKLFEQLKPGGRMVVPVGTVVQILMVIDKKEDGTMHVARHELVRFVPLTEKARQLADSGRLA